MTTFAQEQFYAHADACEQCRAHIEQEGRVVAVCISGWDAYKMALQSLWDKSSTYNLANPGADVSFGQAWTDRLKEEYEFHKMQEHGETLQMFEEVVSDLHSQISAWSHTKEIHNSPDIQGVFALVEALRFKLGQLSKRGILR